MGSLCTGRILQMHLCLASFANALRKLCSWMPGHDDEEDQHAKSGTGGLTDTQKDSLGMRNLSFAYAHPIRMSLLRFTASTMFQSGAPHSGFKIWVSGGLASSPGWSKS